MSASFSPTSSALLLASELASKTEAKPATDTKAEAPKPVVAGDSAPVVAEGVVAEGLSVVTHKVIASKRTGDSKEDYWTQYQVWGEITNHSSEVMEAASGTITCSRGGLLLAALRCALTGVDPLWILLLVTASFPAHLYDLLRRARARSR